MRLKLSECLEQYNQTNGGNLSLRQLALKVWTDNRNDQTKINRMSALNTGHVTASIKDLVEISEYLECEPTNLLTWEGVKN